MGLDAGELPEAAVDGSPDGRGAGADAAARPASYLVLWDTPMRAEARADAATVKSVLRGSLVAPVDASAAATGGYLKVKFLTKTGWMPTSRLAGVAPGTRMREVALAHPKAFFKRQVFHSVWNPTGPSTSGNCAPASLAIAAKALGKEPPDLDVEESIDRVRKLMGKASDSGGANLDQVRTGVEKLGLKYVAMAKGGLETQLGKGRLVVLVGTPGDGGGGSSTAYQKAFATAGYAYTFDGRHSILVMALRASGKYLVADPLSKLGPLELTRSQMHDFYARWGGEGTSIWAE